MREAQHRRRRQADKIGGELDAIAGALIDLVRLRSGALPDDVAVALAR